MEEIPPAARLTCHLGSHGRQKWSCCSRGADSPATFSYLAILTVTTWVLVGASPGVVDAMLHTQSTNLSHLDHDPTRGSGLQPISGVASPRLENSVDIGVSYGFAAVAALFTYGSPAAGARLIWAAGLPAYVCVGMLLDGSFTSWPRDGRTDRLRALSAYPGWRRRESAYRAPPASHSDPTRRTGVSGMNSTASSLYPHGYKPKWTEQL
jgi:hypothetical protein